MKIDEAKIIEYKKGGSTNTAALVLRLDPEKGRLDGKDYFKESRENIIYGAKWEEFDKEIKEYAATLPKEINDRRLRCATPRISKKNKPPAASYVSRRRLLYAGKRGKAGGPVLPRFPRIARIPALPRRPCRGSIARPRIHAQASPPHRHAANQSLPLYKKDRKPALPVLLSQIQALSLSCFLGRPMSARRASLGSCPS